MSTALRYFTSCFAACSSSAAAAEQSKRLKALNSRASDNGRANSRLARVSQDANAFTQARLHHDRQLNADISSTPGVGSTCGQNFLLFSKLVRFAIQSKLGMTPASDLRMNSPGETSHIASSLDLPDLIKTSRPYFIDALNNSLSFADFTPELIKVFLAHDTSIQDLVRLLPILCDGSLERCVSEFSAQMPWFPIDQLQKSLIDWRQTREFKLLSEFVRQFSPAEQALFLKQFDRAGFGIFKRSFLRLVNNQDKDSVPNIFQALKNSVLTKIENDGIDVHEYFNNIAQSINTPQALASWLTETEVQQVHTNHQPQLQDQINQLWLAAADLVKASDRSVQIDILPDSVPQQLIDKAFELPWLLTEDNCCIDANGMLLTSEHPLVDALRSDPHIQQLSTDKNKASQDALVQVIMHYLPRLALLMTDVGFDREALSLLLKQSLMPRHLVELGLDTLDRLTSLFPKELLLSISLRLSGLSQDKLQILIESVPQQTWHLMADRLADAIKQLDPYKNLDFYRHFAEKLCIGLGENKVIQSVARVLTKGYYSALSLPEQRALMVGVLQGGGPALTEHGELTETEFGALAARMVQAGGPCFQKAMQLFKSDIPTLSLQKALEQVSSGIYPLPQSTVESILASGFSKLHWRDGQSFELIHPAQYQQKSSDWPSTDEVRQRYLKCLGSATIGQTHSAYIQASGSPASKPLLVAIKIQRPAILQAIRREMAAMQRIQGLNDNTRRTLHELEQSIVVETHFEREAAFADILKKMYTPFKNSNCELHVVHILAQSPEMLVEQFVSGQPVMKLVDHYLKHSTLERQAHFLERVGDGLSLLVGAFTRAAILGDQEHAAELVFKKPEVNPSKGQSKSLKIALFQQRGQWYVQNKEKCKPLPLTISTILEKYKGNKLSGSLMSALSLSDYAAVCHSFRNAFDESAIFKGESFVDSDRHAGNLLYQEQPHGPDKLTVIDTGAGCVVNKLERTGMVKLAIGIATANSNIVLEGLTALIPEISNRTASEHATLLSDIEAVVMSRQIEQEKLSILYQFLLVADAVNGDESEAGYFQQLHEPALAALKTDLLSFDEPIKSESALQYYLNLKNVNSVSVAGLKKAGQSYQDYIGNLNFERMVVFSRQGKVNPATWITDGNNTLLFVQTIRRLANVLDKNNLSAPEVVIQVNRGTKFVEDQLRDLNVVKRELLQKVKTSAIPVDQQSLRLREKIIQQLQPVALGPAYVKSIISLQIINNSLEALGWQSLNAMYSLASERLGALKASIG